MMPINSGSFSKALQVGINAWYGDTYDEFPVEYTALVDTFTSRKAYEEDVGYSGFGLAQVKPEGQGVAFDAAVQGYTTRYTHIVYALGFMITREMVDDDQYDIIAETRARALAMSMRQTKETIVANIYNRAFTNGYTGGDSSILLTTSHPNRIKQ